MYKIAHSSKNSEIEKYHSLKSGVEPSPCVKEYPLNTPITNVFSVTLNSKT